MWKGDPWMLWDDLLDHWIWSQMFMMVKCIDVWFVCLGWGWLQAGFHMKYFVVITTLRQENPVTGVKLETGNEKLIHV